MKVYLRFCPRIQREGSERSKSCVRVHRDATSVSVGQSRDARTTFKGFDRVFGEHSTQLKIYERVAYPLVRHLMSGRSCCIIAYGEKGSGKTYTLMGDVSAKSCISSISSCGVSRALLKNRGQHKPHREPEEPPSEVPPNPQQRRRNEKRRQRREKGSGALEPLAEEPVEGSANSVENDHTGIIARMAHDIFYHIQSCQGDDVSFAVFCSFVEIYFEELTDLLSKSRKLNISEDAKRGVYIEDATEEEAKNEGKIMELLERGIEQRTTSSTEGHVDSSKSHAIFLIRVEKRKASTGVKTSSLVSVMDLAGSNISGEGPGPAHLAGEAQMINEGLAALRNVISAVSEGRKDAPFEDSKLTMLLRDAIGGRTKTSLLVTACPSVNNIDETLSSIRLGQTAKKTARALIVSEEDSLPSYKDKLVLSEKKQDELIRLMEHMSREMHQLRAESSGRIPQESRGVDSKDRLPSTTAQSIVDVDRVDELQNISASNSESEVHASSRMEEDLARAREELANVSSLLRSAARRMEDDFSAAQGEIMSEESYPRDIPRSVASRRSSYSTTMTNFTTVTNIKSVECEAKQVEEDLADTQRVFNRMASMRSCRSGKRSVGSTADSPKDQDSDVSAAKDSSEPFEHVSSVDKLNVDGALHELAKRERLVKDMEKEMEVLRNDNEMLARVKKEREEDVVCARKEAKLLYLRATEAEQKLKRSQRSGELGNTMEIARRNSTGQTVACDDNLDVSNVVGRRYLRDSDGVSDYVPGEDDSLSLATGDDSAEEHIRVFLRLRAMSKLEASRRSRRCIEVHDDVTSFTVDSPLEGDFEFSYDKVFDTNSSQSSVYSSVGAPIATSLLSGINCCIVAYGLTGSGKTYTLVGGNELPGQNGQTLEDDDSVGIAPRLIKDIFGSMSDCPPTTEFSVRCSFVAIYLEKIFDLLEPQVAKHLRVKEDLQGIHIDDVSEACCFREPDVISLIQRGKGVLSALSVRLDLTVARASTIFIVRLSQRNLKTGKTKNAVLHLADIAGCESSFKSKGQASHEDKTFHRPFSVLANVIEALADGKVDAPYRDAKLTSVLKEAFGGNCRTSFVVTASPSSYSMSETVTTIRLGQRVQRVINTPRVNEDIPLVQYRKWLIASEIKRNELSCFVKEMVEHMTNSNDVEAVLPEQLWHSLEAIIKDEESLHNPCRKSLCVGDVRALAKCGLKWKALSLELMKRLPSSKKLNAIDDHARSESYIEDIQSEILILRRQNDLLINDQKKKEEELGVVKKDLNLLTLKRSELEHKLGVSQYREKEATMFIRQLRRICWHLQDITKSRNADISELAASISGAPDLTGLVDMDRLLLEAGLIDSSDINNDETDHTLDSFSSDVDEAASARVEHASDPSYYVNFPTRSDEASTDDQDSTEDCNRQDRTPGHRKLLLGRQVSWPFQRRDGPSREPTEKTDELEEYSSEKSLVPDAASASTNKYTQLVSDLRAMSAKCVELQMQLNDERSKVDILTNRSGPLHQRRLAQEVVTLMKEKERMTRGAKAATWKLQELHVVNKILDKQAQEAKQQVSFLEDGFQRLQETFHATALDSLDGDARLREKVANLQGLVDGLTVPHRKSVFGSLPRSDAESLNLAIRGCLGRNNVETEKTRYASLPFSCRCLILVASGKLPERSPALCKRRRSKYPRRSAKTSASQGGLRRKDGRIQVRSQRSLPATFGGRINCKSLFSCS